MEWIHLLQNISTFFAVGWNTFLDLKERKVSLWVIGIYGVIGFFLRLWDGDAMLSIVLSLIPGIICAGIAWLSREKVGYGDGILLIAMGFYLPINNVLRMCMIAILASGIVALVLFVIFHKKKDYQLPFVPFLFLSYFIVRCSYA